MKRSKLMKQMLLGIVMLLMLGILTGCGKMTAEEIIEKYTSSNASVDNCEATMKMNMGMSDGTNELNIVVDSDMKLMTTPEYKANVTMKMDMGEMGSYDMDTYIVKEDDSYYTYINTMDTWMKQEIASDNIDAELATYSDQVNADVYIKNMQNFNLAGEETVGEKETYKIEGIVTGEALKEVLENSSAADYAAADLDDIDFSTLGDLTITLWIDKKEFTPVKMYMDMTQMMNSLMTGEDLGVSISTCTMELEYTGFGTVTEITLPEEAKDAILMETEDTETSDDAETSEDTTEETEDAAE